MNTPMTDLGAAYGKLSANVRGALWMLASAVLFTLMTTLIKFLGDDYSPALQTFYRQAAGLVVMLPLILRNPATAFRTTRPGIMLFRAFVGTGAMILAFYAYQEMPLAEANALSFTRTLWVVPLAAFVLHERVGPYRLAATFVGFLGVLLILQPTLLHADGLAPFAALASALLFAMTLTGMKIMSRDNTVLVITTWSAVLGFVLTVPFAIAEWRVPGWTDLLLLCAMGVFGLLNQVCYIKGMSVGDAVAMAPIDYTRLVFALLVGFFLFQDVPNPVAMLGAAVVIASTLFITLREAWLRLPPRPPSDQ